MNIQLLKVSYFFLIVLLFSNIGTSIADTIVLKNGSKIEVDKAWNEGGFIKGSRGNGTIGFPEDSVGTVIYENNKQHDSFEFDMWKAGITIEKAIKIAESNDLPLVRAGIITGAYNFRPKVYEDINTSDIFSYKTRLMEKNAEVTLFFTPTSRLLHKVIVSFHGIGTNTKEFKNEILDMIQSKYGENNRYSKQLFGDTHKWNMENKYSVNMIYQAGYIKIEYSDNALSRQNEAEKMKIEDKKRKEYTEKDSPKF